MEPVQEQYSGDAASHPVIEVRGVRHEFTTRHDATPRVALETTNVSVERNSFVSIVGPSGCGKSTLLRIIAGLVEPTEGQVLLDGALSAGTSARKGMAFQQDSVFPWLTVRKNVEYGLRMKRMRKAERSEIADHWIDLVGLTSFADAYPRELSGGMRKRVDLARLYANDPEVMLMDEPFGALDRLTREHMQTELLDLWERKRKTVIFVTHDLDEAIFLSDIVMVMSARPGRVHAVETCTLPRPRTSDMRLSEPFIAARRRLDDALESGSGSYSEHQSLGVAHS